MSWAGSMAEKGNFKFIINKKDLKKIERDLRERNRNDDI